MRVKYVSRVTSLITCVLYLLCLIYGHNASAESEHSRSDTTPQRIVVFPLYAEEILFELVEPERIVYVGHRFVESGIGVWPTMEACRNVKGECWQNTSEEEILTLRPDLLIFGAALQDEFDEIFPLLAASGIDTLFLDVPESVDAIVDTITLLGDAVHNPEKAQSMISDMIISVEYAKHLTNSIPENELKTAVLYGEPNIFFNIVTNLCNINGVYCDEVSALVEVNPDVIIVLPYCMDDGYLMAIGKAYCDAYVNSLEHKLSYIEGNDTFASKIRVLDFHGSQYIAASAIHLIEVMYSEYLN